jgi:hypothetical protein
MFAQNVVFFLSVGMHLHFFSVFWATKNMALPRKSDESSQVFSKFWLSFAMVRTSRLATRLLASADTKQIKGLYSKMRKY